MNMITLLVVLLTLKSLVHLIILHHLVSKIKMDLTLPTVPVNQVIWLLTARVLILLDVKRIYLLKVK